MPNRTNSNSLVLLTINKLNDPTLGFRYEFLKKYSLPDNRNFMMVLIHQFH